METISKNYFGSAPLQYSQVPLSVLIHFMKQLDRSDISWPKTRPILFKYTHFGLKKNGNIKFCPHSSFISRNTISYISFWFGIEWHLSQLYISYCSKTRVKNQNQIVWPCFDRWRSTPWMLLKNIRTLVSLERRTSAAK
jgi:hypothetical protein